MTWMPGLAYLLCLSLSGYGGFSADGRTLARLDRACGPLQQPRRGRHRRVVRQVQGVRPADPRRALPSFSLPWARGCSSYSALVATEDERRREARDAGLRRVALAGFRQPARRVIAMGVLAGILATLGAAIIGEVIARRVFELDLPPSLGLWLAGPLAGIALLSLNAWLSARKVLRASPPSPLRDSV